MKKGISELRDILTAHIDCVWIKTVEEKEAIQDIYGLCRMAFKNYGFHVWSNTEGLRTLPSTAYETPEPPNPKYREIPALFGYITAQEEEDKGSSNVFVLRDLHTLITNPKTVRYIRDIKEYPHAHTNTLIVVSPVVELPAEISRLFRVIDYDLPDREDIFKLVEKANNRISEMSLKNPNGEYKPLSNEDLSIIVTSCLGMTQKEISMALAESLVKYKTLNMEFLAQNKIQSVKKTGVLDYKVPKLTLEDVGGNAALKEWLYEQKDAYSEEAKAFGLDMPKGYLSIGVPGTAC